jgi:hypothetical protein
LLPPDGRFCPIEAKGSLDVESVPVAWVEDAARACSSCCRSEEDPTLEMVICLSFEERAPVPAPHARAEARRGERNAKNVPYFKLLRS